MLRKSLEQARAAAGEAQVTSTQRVNEAQTVLEALQADADRTKADEESAQSVLNEATAALEAAQSTVVNEETLCEEAKAVKAGLADERQRIEAAKNEVESILTGSFRMLLDGGWEDEGLRDACIEAVCSYLVSASADVVLLASLPKALGRRPTEHGVFDKIAVDEASRVLSEKVAECTAKLAEGEEQFEDAKAEHTGAWAVLDLAREKVQAASEVRDKADATLQTAAVDKKLALSKVMDQETILEALRSETKLADGKVEQFELALSAFAQLESGEDADMENKENVVSVEEVKGKAMEIDQAQVAITA